MSRDTEVRFTSYIYVIPSLRIPPNSRESGTTNSLMQQSSSVSSSKLATVTLAQIVASRRRNIHHWTTTTTTATTATATTTTTTCRCRFSDVRLRFTTLRAIVLSDISIIHCHPLPPPRLSLLLSSIAFFLRIAHTNEHTRPVTRRTHPSR